MQPEQKPQNGISLESRKRTCRETEKKSSFCSFKCDPFKSFCLLRVESLWFPSAGPLYLETVKGPHPRVTMSTDVTRAPYMEKNVQRRRHETLEFLGQCVNTLRINDDRRSQGKTLPSFCAWPRLLFTRSIKKKQRREQSTVRRLFLKLLDKVHQLLMYWLQFQW